MKRLIQKGPRCLVWSAAMLFEADPEDIMEFVGHDCVKGVHIQEIQAFAFSLGYLLAPFEPRPSLGDNQVLVPNWEGEPWLQFEGIMLGQNRNGNLHAVAWDRSNILDPAPMPDFEGYHQFWAKIKIKHLA